MSMQLKNLTRMAAPETGNNAIWHYVARNGSPLEPGYFNAAYQMLGEDDVIFAIVCRNGVSEKTLILTVTESNQNGVKVRGPSLAAPIQPATKEAADAQTSDQQPIRGRGGDGSVSTAAAGSTTGTGDTEKRKAGRPKTKA